MFPGPLATQGRMFCTVPAAANEFGPSTVAPASTGGVRLCARVWR